MSPRRSTGPPSPPWNRSSRINRETSLVSGSSELQVCAHALSQAPRSARWPRESWAETRGQLFSFQDGHPNLYAPGKRPFQTIIPGFATRGGQP